MFILTIITFITLVFLTLFFVFTPIRICGDSMHPTLIDGDVYFTLRVSKLHKFKEGDIYVYRTPYDKSKYAVKRLISSQGHYLFFEGDNKKVSYDSRHYGCISPKQVKFRVLKRKE